MNVDDLLKQAWEAVKKAGIPPELQQTALKEAIDFLRGSSEVDGTSRDKPPDAATKPRAASKKSAVKPKPNKAPAARTTGEPINIDEDSFFRQLSTESGVTEDDLTDILNIASDGSIQVAPPTRNLGTSISEQAKTVIALVAGARSKGLGEKPVSADAVRRELDRKHCYDVKNFSVYHLGPLKGFNAGSKGEILLTSKWVNEFTAAVDKAHGRSPSAE